ncbi:potassium channel family protein [Hyperthermus butylicus]|uniref:K+ transport system protein n=1 Tax=Hyperthermus butylicus (strain DSM 5456 / JCM 9403 / PLM1-5) TaxID=415426 RepID=A2BL99_HYPBU|nr:TrkA family potassium uptake protein [Hyperthermus butylicus]ABM80760.1 putative K+ transport system protein [Hyperthermus butylicus DSM 5456]
MRILIVGAGKLGSLLAKKLSEKGHDVIVIDVDKQRAEQVAAEADVAAYARDATDPSVYDEINLANIDVVVATTNRDEVNLFVALMAREYGVSRVIVKVRDARIGQIITRMGIAEHVVVEPQVISSIVEGFIEGKYNIVELAPVFVGGFRLVTITIPEGSSVEGQMIDDIKYPRHGVKILAVFDGENFHDPSVVRLEAGYQIIALVRDDVIEEFLEAFR